MHALIRSGCPIPPILRKINSVRFPKYFHKSILCVKVRICDYAGFVQSFNECIINRICIFIPIQ